MDMFIVAIAGVVLFVVARSFMQYEEDNLQHNQTKEQNNTSANSQESVPPDNINTQEQSSEDVNNMQLEVGLVVAMMAKLSKSDGKVCMLEKELIEFCFKDFSAPFENPSQIETVLRKIFEDEQNKDSSFEDLALEFYRINKHSYTKRMKVLQHLTNLAYVDKVLSDSEEKMLQKISTILKISSEDYAYAIKSFHDFYLKDTENMDTKEAYLILDAHSDDTMSVIKTKYRALVKKYHPDLLHSKGFEDDYVQDYTRKLQEVNEAYEHIKKHRK